MPTPKATIGGIDFRSPTVRYGQMTSDTDFSTEATSDAIVADDQFIHGGHEMTKRIIVYDSFQPSNFQSRISPSLTMKAFSANLAIGAS